MDLSVFNDIAPSVNNILAPFSMLLLIAVLVREQHFSSSSVAVLVLCLGEGIESLSGPHLIALSKITAQYGYVGWYFGWITLHITCLMLLRKLHHVFRLHLSTVALTVAWYYMAYVVLQAIDFIDRVTFDSGMFAAVYQVSTLTLNVLIIPVVAYLFARDYGKRKRQSILQEA